MAAIIEELIAVVYFQAAEKYMVSNHTNNTCSYESSEMILFKTIRMITNPHHYIHWNHSEEKPQEREGKYRYIWNSVFSCNKGAGPTDSGQHHEYIYFFVFHDNLISKSMYHGKFYYPLPILSISTSS